MLIRVEKESDRAAVYRINTAAFERHAEAELVETLRECVQPLISFVAEMDAAVVGHIMFSPVCVSADSRLRLMGLAPMAVAPAYQRQGIGSALVRAGLKRCKALACNAVVVLGHPEYYPRFGFLPASRFGLRCEYSVSDEAFMAMELEPGVFERCIRSGQPGVVRYHAAFSKV